MYQFGFIGGHVAFQDRVNLAPTATYRHERTPAAAGQPIVACSPALPACNTADAIDVSDVMRDMYDTDVQAAFAQVVSRLFGVDTRPSDGSVFSVVRVDGRGFAVGNPCTAGATSCVAIPAGVARLVATLRALDEQQLKDASCAALR